MLSTICEDLSSYADSIERGREPCIYRHLLNCFHDLLSRRTNIERRIDMHRKLRLRRAQSATHGNGSEFFGLRIEPRATDDVTIRKLDDEAAQIGAISLRLSMIAVPLLPLTRWSVLTPCSYRSGAVVLSKEVSLSSSTSPRCSKISRAAEMLLRAAGKPA